MSLLFVTKLRLSHFRNSSHVVLTDFDKKNYIHGSNGVGKTNLLDAISRFISQTGLKNQSAKYCTNMSYPDDGWGIDIHLKTETMPVQMRTGIPKAGKNKVITYYDKKISLSEAQSLMPCLWMTPVGETVFLSENALIRRYFNDILSIFYPNFYHHYNLYERATKQRLKLLIDEDVPNTKWLYALEYEMAENALLLSKYYYDFLALIRKTQEEISSKIATYLPQFSLDYSWYETPIDTLKDYQDKLFEHRSLDKKSSRSLFGIHRLNWQVRHIAKNNIDIAYCSTGEQKAVLLFMLFVVNHAFIDLHKKAPLILLDDAYAHFDREKIDFLEEYLSEIPNQIFLTGTEFPFICDNQQKAFFPISENFMNQRETLSLF